MRYLATEVHATHAGQHQVKQHQVGDGVAQNACMARSPSATKVGSKAPPAKHDGEHLGEGGVVIDDQHAKGKGLSFHGKHKEIVTVTGRLSTQKVQRTPIGGVRHPPFGAHQRKKGGRRE